MEEDKLKEILNKRVRDLQRDINFIYALGETPRVEEEEKRIIEEVLNLIDRLQKKNEELKENYKVLENEYITNSIPKSIIQDKIEEILNNSKYRCVDCKWNYIEVVQLLENMLEGE